MSSGWLQSQYSHKESVLEGNLSIYLSVCLSADFHWCKQLQKLGDRLLPRVSMYGQTVGVCKYISHDNVHMSICLPL